VLSFTAEEAWAVLERDPLASGFLTTWTAPVLDLDPAAAAALDARWSSVREVRAVVLRELEGLRSAGAIGSGLAAEVEIELPSPAHDALAALGEELRFVMITSAATVRPGAALRVSARPSSGTKCARCWHYRADVGAHPSHPELCGRCAGNLAGSPETRLHA